MKWIRKSGIKPPLDSQDSGSQMQEVLPQPSTGQKGDSVIAEALYDTFQSGRQPCKDDVPC
jgi:hypothetical protein